MSHWSKGAKHIKQKSSRLTTSFRFAVGQGCSKVAQLRERTPIAALRNCKIKTHRPRMICVIFLDQGTLPKIDTDAKTVLRILSEEAPKRPFFPSKRIPSSTTSGESKACLSSAVKTPLEPQAFIASSWRCWLMAGSESVTSPDIKLSRYTCHQARVGVDSAMAWANQRGNGVPLANSSSGGNPFFKEFHGRFVA